MHACVSLAHPPTIFPPVPLLSLLSFSVVNISPGGPSIYPVSAVSRGADTRTVSRGDGAGVVTWLIFEFRADITRAHLTCARQSPPRPRRVVPRFIPLMTLFVSFPSFSLLSRVLFCFFSGEVKFFWRIILNYTFEFNNLDDGFWAIIHERSYEIFFFFLEERVD